MAKAFSEIITTDSSPFDSAEPKLTLKRVTSKKMLEKINSNIIRHLPGPRELVPGEIVCNRYKVLCLIGRGAMGSVYRVEQVALRKQLALKTLNTVAVSDANIRRFQNEALAASKLEHPNLVRALDYGWLETQPFLVMDLVEGQTLADYLKTAARLPVEFAFQVFIPICFALAYAHGQGVVHRDLKPSNIVLSADRKYTAVQVVPKIVDFGIAKLDYGQEGTLTKAGEVFGTPLYMSPEQCIGGKVDGRSDIYTLGCVLYESLTGAPPFAGPSALETMMQHRSEKPLALKQASLGSDFHPALEQIVFKMLAKDPHDRYQSCVDVAKDLASLQRGENVQVSHTNQVRSQCRLLNRDITKAIFVMCILVGSFVFRQTQIKTENNVAAQPDSMPSDHLVSIAGTEGILSPFSKIVGDKKVFDFGKSKLGEFVSPNRHVKAAGTVEFPKTERLFLETSFITACHSPQLLLRFRDDDLDGLRLIYEPDYEIYLDKIPDSIFDETLSFVSHLKSLQKIMLNDAPISMRGLNNLHLEERTRLQELDISNTLVNGKELARSPVLRQLAGLEMGRGHELEAVLRALQDSQKIRSLNLAYSNLTDADIGILITMPNLLKLDLSGNKITNDGLARLTKLEKLSDLKLEDCPVTIAGISSLAKMRNLQSVNLPTHLRLSREAIEDELPNCAVAFQAMKFNTLIRSQPDP